MIRNLSITTQGHAAEVRIDGHDIADGLTGLTLSMGVGRIPTATLELLIPDVTELHDAETQLLIPDSTRDVLVALGWTPPTGEPKED